MAMQLNRLGETEIAAKVAELFRFWFALFEPMDWAERLELLQSIDGEIACDMRSREHARIISCRFTQRMITHLGDRPVGNRNQAFFYLHSAHSPHRDAARLWMRLAQEHRWGEMAPQNLDFWQRFKT
jgi:hypothetical protein